MDCKCGGTINQSEYTRKHPPVTIYTRACSACHREEKSIDLQHWQAAASFWKDHPLLKVKLKTARGDQIDLI